MKKVALLVGVEEYRDPQISRLQFAAADVKSFADRLRAKCGFEQVVTLADRTGDQPPDCLTVTTALRNLAVELRPGDLFLFFFSGHGVEVGGQGYLLTCDSSQAFPQLGSLPMKILQESLARLEGVHRVLLIDACRNTPVAGKGDGENRMSDVISKDIVAAVRAGHKGSAAATALLSACSAGQRAYEWPAKGHGVFTHYLLEGLDGAAWKGEALEFKELARYVSREVRRWSTNMPGTHTPQEPWYEEFGSPEPILIAETAVPYAQPVEPARPVKRQEDRTPPPLKKRDPPPAEPVPSRHGPPLTPPKRSDVGVQPPVRPPQAGPKRAAGIPTTGMIAGVLLLVALVAVGGGVLYSKRVSPSYTVEPKVADKVDSARKDVSAEVGLFHGFNDDINAVAVAASGKIAAAATRNGVAIYDLETGENMHTFPGAATCVAISSQGVVAAGRPKPIVPELSVPKGGGYSSLPIVKQPSGFAAGLARPRASREVAGGPINAAASADEPQDVIVLWNLSTREKLGELNGFSGPVTSIAFSADGRYLASGSDTTSDGVPAASHVMLWDVATRGMSQIQTEETGSITSLAFSPDGLSLATASRGGAPDPSGIAPSTARLWTVPNLDLRQSMPYSSWVSAVGFTRDSGSLVIGAGSAIHIQALGKGQNWDFEKLPGRVNCLAVSPADVVVAGLDQGSVRAWDATTGQELKTSPLDASSVPPPTALGPYQPQHRSRSAAARGRVNTLAFVDQQRLLIGSAVGLEIWDIEAGMEVLKPRP